MMIDPGRLREQVVIQVKTSDPDGGGGRTSPEWRDILDGDVWAEVVPVSSYERVRAQQAGATITHRGLIRYRPDVTAVMRLKWGERILNMAAAPIDLGERHQWLQLQLREEA